MFKKKKKKKNPQKLYLKIINHKKVIFIFGQFLEMDMNFKI